MMTDKTLTCRDCGASFVFTASEQAFFAEKGFTNQPGRCPSCRAAHKANRSDGYGGGSYSSGGYERREREMFPAVCATCGRDTQVPFQPRTDRPVYCSSCFEQQRGGASSGSSRGGRNRW
ncbi:MAG: zinc-ribbon domain containing protein [Chloroflexi bacterium]|nr:zinc-ribbon domain containing protein [Chloroflexota bacterium]